LRATLSRGEIDYIASHRVLIREACDLAMVFDLHPNLQPEEPASGDELIVSRVDQAEEILDAIGDIAASGSRSSGRDVPMFIIRSRSL
jgi:hypothetical protein